MYRHRIIDDITALLGVARMEFGCEAADTITLAHDVLRRSSEIYVGDYANFKEAQLRARENYDIRDLTSMPLPISGPILLTYRLVPSEEERRQLIENGSIPAPRRAVLLDRAEDNTMCFSLFRPEGAEHWTISPVLLVAWPDGRISVSRFDGGIRDAAGTPEADDMLFEIGVLMFALNVATCGNVRLKFVDADAERLNRKRIRDGREPVVGHYALVRLEGDEIVEVISLCGGHYKTYTEDAPLFGKHVGRWWWPAHVRAT